MLYDRLYSRVCTRYQDQLFQISIQLTVDSSGYRFMGGYLGKETHYSYIVLAARLLKRWVASEKESVRFIQDFELVKCLQRCTNLYDTQLFVLSQH